MKSICKTFWPYFALFIVSLFPLTEAIAITYSASADFNVVANPRGVWSYGVYDRTTPGGIFLPFNSNLVDSESMEWGNSAHVMYNSSNATIVRRGSSMLPHQIVIQPSSDSRPGVLRFVAPVAANYRINVNFTGRDSAPVNSSNVVVNRNGSAVWGTAISTFGGAGVTYSATLALAAGDRMDFVAGDGGNGPLGDAVGVSAIISAGCVADVDDGQFSGRQDGGVGIEDLLYYLFFYDIAWPTVDIDDGSGAGIPDGGVGIEDLLFYFSHYNAGC